MGLPRVNKISKISGTNSVLAKLAAMEKVGRQAKVTGVVGYDTPYAVFVHERTDLNHAKGTQAKFLEQPARELTSNGAIANVMRRVYKQTKSMERAVYAGLLLLQAASQKIVPVDTGALKASCYVRVDKE